MSALSEGEPVKAHGSKRTFLFRQPITVSSYLIAIVVGALERREISSRCAVWAEASIVDKVGFLIFLITVANS
jgi:leukotriene-A4 hydrolase